MKKGLSLIEILVVIAVFSILGIVATQSILLTLRGTRKSESVVKVRENLDYSLAIIERQLRNAEAVSPCPNPNPLVLNYSDENGNPNTFSCVNIGPTDGYIASGSAKLTSPDISVTSCSFTCSAGTSSTPPSATISVSGQSTGTTGIEASQVSVETQIFLRTY